MIYYENIKHLASVFSELPFVSIFKGNSIRHPLKGKSFCDSVYETFIIKEILTVKKDTKKKSYISIKN